MMDRKFKILNTTSAILCVLLMALLALGDSRSPHQRLKKGRDWRLASQHVHQVMVQGRCEAPILELVKVTEVYKNTEPKEYRPRCVHLHVCSDRSGCCSVPGMRCAPKRAEEVTLHFQVLDFSVIPPKPSVQQLVFLNHTECYCGDINNMSNVISGSMSNSLAKASAKTDYPKARFPSTTRTIGVSSKPHLVSAGKSSCQKVNFFSYCQRPGFLTLVSLMALLEMHVIFL